MRLARRWLRWSMAAALAALLVVYACSDTRTFDLPDPSAGISVFIQGGRLTVYTPPGQSWIAVRGLEHWSWWWSFDRTGSWWWLHIPLWAFALPLAAATAWAWWPRRTPPGRCANCGYDRAGLDARAVCPECGASAALAR